MLAFLRRDRVAGALALGCAVVAVLWANLDAAGYASLRHLDLGPLDLEHWTADGGLALFFVVAGLELRHELTDGALRDPAHAVVPVVAALGGVVVPALLFVALNLTSGDLRGWAVPSATDIAFALAVLAVVGSGLPARVRAFLLTLAVVDDLVVIVVIALFYTTSLQLWWLLGAAAGLAAYAGLQRWVDPAWLLLPIGAATWWCCLRSGVHPTVAGLALGLLTRSASLTRLRQALTPWSAGLAVPLFALLAAGVTLHPSGLLQPLALGVALGLVVGKPVGVLGGAWLAGRLTGRGPGMPRGDLAGVALLCGVGFTVALLVSDLAFADARAEQAKTAVLLGSLVSTTLAAVVLHRRRRLAVG